MNTLDRIDPQRVLVQRCLLLCLLLCYPLSLVVPSHWGWENGVVENSQVVVLLAGLAFAGRAWLRGTKEAAAMLALCAMPVWFLMAGRELSWGAVFLPPLGFGAEGPVFSSRILPYRPLVPLVGGLLVLGSLIVFVRHGLHRHLKRVAAAGRFPWLCVVVVFGAAICSTLGDGHVPAFARDWMSKAQVFEEMAELVGYMALVVAQGVLLRYKAPGGAPVRTAEAVH